MHPPSVEEVGMDAPSGVAYALAPSPKPTSAKPTKKRMPDRVLVSTYVPLLERVHPLTDMAAPNLEDMLKIVHRWSPLNQEESPVTHMHDLYLHCFRMPVVARLEQYTILLPVYMDKEDFQLVADDGMLIHNHNFHRSTKLVSADFCDYQFCVVIFFLTYVLF